MDDNLEKVKTEMQIHNATKNTTALRKYWAKAVENAFLYYLDESKVYNRKIKVRGEATLIHVKPSTARKNRSEDRTLGTACIEAERSVKQARRCEQFAFRLGLIMEEKEGPDEEANLLWAQQARRKGHREACGGPSLGEGSQKQNGRPRNRR